jgi:hypothetical protein
MQKYFLKAKNGALRVVQYLEIPEKKRTFEQSLQAINAYWIPGGAIHPMKTLPFIPKNHRNMKLFWAALKQTPDAWEAVPIE